ncbi:hypothetical protein Clacol_003987 [Clathrus columnatus]|uniref:Aminoglycoside phosphotransferase domain-containing protein n=1 Tax=Clathrus columnatus TaxID=1419009 RepID=A0AAV5AAW6_9AGAM|nr:hypothetical protein Clacol_003987 [Clathrus columnatus]
MLPSLLTVPNELSQTERERIVEYYENIVEKKNFYAKYFDIDLEGRPTFFVKHGLDGLVEASTQSFFYNLAQKDESAPRIPKVYDAFRQNGHCFFVMEKIELPTLSTCEISEDDAVKSVASAIEWLFAQLPSVPTSIFGRISSEPSCARHEFFKDQEAPVCFANSDALTKYVNKAFSRCPGKPKRTVSFSDELAIYHSDIHKDNFLHDIKTGKTWIIDFQHIGVFPEPFQTYSLFNTGNDFATSVGKHLGHQPSDIADLLTFAGGLLKITAENASLKLDRFGEPISERDVEPFSNRDEYIELYDRIEPHKGAILTINPDISTFIRLTTYYLTTVVIFQQAFSSVIEVAPVIHHIHHMCDPLLTIPNELTQTERERIVEHFKNIPREERFNTNHFDIDLEGRPTFFVKHGLDVLDEASTQFFFYTLAQKDESAPRIPKVYGAFQDSYLFFVMEKIELPTLSTCEISEDDRVKSAASAVKWLLAQLPSVPTSIFGRISSEPSCVRHHFFKDHEAPVCFAHADALTKYVNKAFSRCPGKPKRTVSFSDELAIFHSDIRKDNFLHDIKTGETWIVDFQDIGVLPEPFQTYAFFNTGNRFAAAVGRHLGYQPSDIANLLTYASGLLQIMGGGATLNLDRFGEPIPKGNVESSVVQNIGTRT